MPREIHDDEELRHLLGVPRLSKHDGILCIELPDGTVVRITAYSEYIHVEHWALDELGDCDANFQTG